MLYAHADGEAAVQTAHLDAAYALIGVEQENGRFAPRADLFEPKGELEVQSLRIGESTWKRDDLKG